MSSFTDPLNRDIDSFGLRKNQVFQAGWSTGRLELVYRLLEAETDDEFFVILEDACRESRQIAEDGIKILTDKKETDSE